MLFSTFKSQSCQYKAQLTINVNLFQKHVCPYYTMCIEPETMGGGVGVGGGGLCLHQCTCTYDDSALRQHFRLYTLFIKRQRIYSYLDHSCNKYCDLIGQCKVSISHINL